MSCIPGRLSRVQIDVGAGYNNLGGLVDVSLSGNVDELECTSHDDDGIRKYIPNHLDFTMDMTLRWDEDEPQQVQLLNTLVPSPSTFALYFFLEDVAGRRRFEADAFITSYSPSGPLDDTAGLDCTLRLSNVVISTVP